MHKVLIVTMHSLRRVFAAETARGKPGVAVHKPRKIIRIIIAAQPGYFSNRFFRLFEHGKRVLDTQANQISHRRNSNGLLKTPRQAGPVQMQAISQLFDAQLGLIPLAVNDLYGLVRQMVLVPGSVS